jgi:hypothetical protein
MTARREPPARRRGTDAGTRRFASPADQHHQEGSLMDVLAPNSAVCDSERAARAGRGEPCPPTSTSLVAPGRLQHRRARCRDGKERPLVRTVRLAALVAVLAVGAAVPGGRDAARDRRAQRSRADPRTESAPGDAKPLRRNDRALQGTSSVLRTRRGCRERRALGQVPRRPRLALVSRRLALSLATHAPGHSPSHGPERPRTAQIRKELS